MSSNGNEGENKNNNNNYGNSNTNGSMSDNYGFFGASALQIRLDTGKVIEEIEFYLRGFREEWYQDPEDGSFKKRMAWKGKAMMNDEGIQSVMSFVIATFNTQVVQGNFVDEDMYAEHLCRTRRDFAFNLMMNMYKYELAQEDYHSVISVIMRYIEVFMTRPLFNKERESYAQTLKSTEVMSTQQRSQGGVSGFFRSIF